MDVVRRGGLREQGPCAIDVVLRRWLLWMLSIPKLLILPEISIGGPAERGPWAMDVVRRMLWVLSMLRLLSLPSCTICRREPFVMDVEPFKLFRLATALVVLRWLLRLLKLLRLAACLICCLGTFAKDVPRVIRPLRVLKLLSLAGRGGTLLVWGRCVPVVNSESDCCLSDEPPTEPRRGKEEVPVEKPRDPCRT